MPAVPVSARAPGVVASQRPRLAASPVRALLGGLSADPRLSWWIRRAIGSVTVGTVMAILLNWWLGIAAAAVAAAADALHCSRTSAVIPAAARAASATRRTRRRLDRVAPAGYLALHTRLIPGSGSVLDHLIVGPAGVYAVGSQRWDRRLPVRWTHGDRLFHGPYDQSGVLKHARWQAGQTARLIGDTFGQQVTVRPAMVIYGPTVPWAVVTIAGVDVFCGRKLRTYLRRETGANRARRLDERQIELIHAVAAQVLPPAR